MDSVMSSYLDETHDPALKSWLDSANVAGTDFPIQNLPFGVFSTGPDHTQRIGVALGDQVFDLQAAAKRMLLDGLSSTVIEACGSDTLNPLMALDKKEHKAVRIVLSRLLRTDSLQQEDAKACLVSQDRVRMHLPARTENFTDFYTSIYHARNTGSMFRPENPLFRNFHTLPVAYHGRASSIRLSGTPCVRPHGQILDEGATDPVYAPTKKLDFELELGVFIASGTQLGETVSLDSAEQHVFGFCLLNDWSARDVQRWEALPLGPFLAKSFMTTISPWVVTLEALAPFRCAASARAEDAPALLPHLDSDTNRKRGGIDISMQALLQTERMRASGQAHVVISQPSYRHQYWTVAQMIAHHTSNGCNLRPGDLIGSGTVSGPLEEDLGCLLELTRDGAQPLHLPNGEIRHYMQNGDDLMLRGRCNRDDFVSIGFGACAGRIVPRHI